MLRVEVQTSRAADYVEARRGAAHRAADVRERSPVLRQRLRRPRAERVHDGVEAFEVVGRDVKNVAYHSLRRGAFVFSAYYRRNIMSAARGLIDDKFSRFSVGAYNCNFHEKFLRVF